MEIIIPVGSIVWGKEQREPLPALISFPSCRHPLWSLQGTWRPRNLESFCRELWCCLWKALPDRRGTFLGQLLEHARAFQSMLEGRCGLRHRLTVGDHFPIRAPTQGQLQKCDQSRFGQTQVRLERRQSDGAISMGHASLLKCAKEKPRPFETWQGCVGSFTNLASKP